MAAFAVRAAISQSNLEPGAIHLLACATTLPDLLVSGLVSTVHGELSELSPLEIVSTQAVGWAGVSVLNYAASQLEPCQQQTEKFFFLPKSGRFTTAYMMLTAV